MAHWVNAEGTCRKVKNLGWLLRNWSRVVSFEVRNQRSSISATHPFVIYANLRGGGFYLTGFNSWRGLLNFLDRPNFRGAPVEFYKCISGETFVLERARFIIGSEGYRAIPSYP